MHPMARVRRKERGMWLQKVNTRPIASPARHGTAIHPAARIQNATEASMPGEGGYRKPRLSSLSCPIAHDKSANGQKEGSKHSRH